MKVRTVIQAFAGALAFTLSLGTLAQDEAAVPDEIVLKNGSRILGTVTEARDGAVKIDTDFAGSLTISLEDIASMHTNSQMNMQLADKSFLTDQTLRVENDQLVLIDDGGVEQDLAIEELLVLNPQPWEMGEGYDWTGLLSFSFAVERGNSKTDELDYNLNSVWRSDDDRYTIRLTGEIDEANDTKNADNWNIIGKYDYFISDVTYWGVNAYAESDEFADLDLRYFVGPYIGREFYTEPVFALSAEVGGSYVNEDFITAEDQDYPAANWALHITSNYLGGESSLYINQLGIWSLEDTEDVIVNTTFGLAFPLLWSLEASAEILLEYDSGAVEGVEKLDETYKFRIGYSW